MMRIQSTRLLIMLLPCILVACVPSAKESADGWKPIEISNYVFDFPPDFKLVKDKGADFPIGEIQGDSMLFNFDFGYYSGDFGKTTQEYLDNGPWRNSIENLVMKKGVTYDDANRPFVEIMSIRPATDADSTVAKGSDYIARCKYDNKEFDFAIFIPDEIRQRNIEIDTVENQLRKIVLAKNPLQAASGIYLKDLASFDPAVNGFLSLSLWSDRLTAKQQETALKIFRTGRKK